ncbi:MAG: PEGA domain-containing protein, partial [Pseudomonadota bacterium]
MTVRSLIAFAITGLIVAPASRPAFADNPIAPIAPIAPTVPAAAAAAAAAKKKNEARERFALGLRLFESGDNSAALAEFKRAYEIFPNPLVLYNIGLVLAAMDRAVDAVGALDSFLNEGGKATAGEPGQRARRVRDEQAKRIAQLLVVTNKPASIEIDGVEAGRAPLERPLRLTSGAHVVSVMAPGCLPLRREVTLAGQVTETLNLTLLPTESNAAHLTVTVGVPGAQIIVNGKSVGLTPLAASIAVAPGTATVEARRAGYRPVSQTIRLDEGARGALTLTLTEDPAAGASLKGRLRLSVSESAPEISVDGAAQPGA